MHPPVLHPISVSEGVNVKAGVDAEVNADMMSDMKTFTVRELDRSPSVVLDAAEAEGAVLVKRRDGRAYRIAPESALPKVRSLPDFDARRRRLGVPKIPAAQSRLVDCWLAGE